MRRTLLAIMFVLVAGLGTVLGGCALTRLPNVPLTLTGSPATPPILGPLDGTAAVASRADWESRRVPRLKTLFQSQIYGAMPAPARVDILSRVVLQAPAKGPIGTIERITLAVSLDRPGPWPGGRPVVDMILMTPKGKGPFPIIAGGTFCGNDALFPKTPEPQTLKVRTTNMPLPPECGGGLPAFMVEAIFGKNANSPPWEAVARHGYALASWHPGDVVPDVPGIAEPYLAALTPDGTPPDQRTGAIAAWAWTLSRMLDVLAADPRIDPEHMLLWGHSRHGKAALLAAAFDPRPVAVWALQSGTGGASLDRDEVGEPIGAITASFPHWFAPVYATTAARPDARLLDQHQLIGLLAPRSVLVGTGRRDQWGDPHGSFRALMGADPVYRLYGLPGFAQTSLTKPAEVGPLAFYMRPGLHGIHSQDWAQALAFFDRTVPKLPPTAPNISLKP